MVKRTNNQTYRGTKYKHIEEQNIKIRQQMKRNNCVMTHKIVVVMKKYI